MICVTTKKMASTVLTCTAMTPLICNTQTQCVTMNLFLHMPLFRHQRALRNLPTGNVLTSMLHIYVPTFLNRIHVLLVSCYKLKKDNPEHKRHEIKIEKDIVQVSCWNSSIAQWDQLPSYRMRRCEKNSSVKDSSRRCEYFLIKDNKGTS